jgi:hypothetical protein
LFRERKQTRAFLGGGESRARRETAKKQAVEEAKHGKALGRLTCCSVVGSSSLDTARESGHDCAPQLFFLACAAATATTERTDSSCSRDALCGYCMIEAVISDLWTKKSSEAKESRQIKCIFIDRVQEWAEHLPFRHKDEHFSPNKILMTPLELLLLGPLE